MMRWTLMAGVVAALLGFGCPDEAAETDVAADLATDAGADTAGDWKVDHFESFGAWESLCDRREGADAESRCYVRLVHVYRPRPQFGALFAFVRTTENAETLEIGSRAVDGVARSRFGKRDSRQRLAAGAR